MSPIELHLKDLSIGNDQLLLESVNFEFKAHGLYILSGVNGSGKSTLLKTILGQHLLQHGSILLNGQNVMDMPLNTRAKLMAYASAHVVQEHFITVENLIQIGRSPFNNHWYKHTANEQFHELVNHLQLTTVLHKPLNAISDGERQKANIARALYQDTALVLLDEPSAFLDYPSKEALFKYLSKIAIENAKIIICSTHDLDIANRFSSLHLHISEKKLFFFQQAPIEFNRL